MAGNQRIAIKDVDAKDDVRYIIFMNKPKHSDLFQLLCKSSNSRGEKKDCSVKALAVVADLTYDAAHLLMAKMGRKNGDGAHTGQSLAALKELGKTYDDVTDRAMFAEIKTIKSLQKLGLNGKYLITVSGHILAMKGGEIHDWTNDRQHRIKKIYRVND